MFRPAAWIRSSSLPALAVALGALIASHAALAAGTASPVPALPADKDPLVQNMDKSVSPGADFFQYACGTWIKNNPIPASERGWGIANLVHEETYKQLRGICEDAAKAGGAPGTSEQKVGDFWGAGMDSARIDEQGVTPLKPYLDQIAAIRTRAELLRPIAVFHMYGFRPLYSMYIGQDEKNSRQYLVHLYQGGLRLPDRDYYFDTDSTPRSMRARST